MTTAVLIIQCLIIILLFIIVGKIFQKEIPVETGKLEEGQGSQRDLTIFRSGLHQTWMIVNVSLYKMYSELEILDFDSIQHKLQQNLEELTKDDDKMKEWSAKFNDYMKDQNKGE